MNAQDFNRLNGLLAKLKVAANTTAKEDGSFRKYNSQSIEALKNFEAHLKQLENGLRTAKVITSEATTVVLMPELREPMRAATS